MAKYATFDAADYLDDEETIAEYITAALEDPNPDVFLTAVRDGTSPDALVSPGHVFPLTARSSRARATLTNQC